LSRAFTATAAEGKTVASRAKILMVHNYSSWGGNLATVLALCRELPSRGFDVALAAPRGQRYVYRFREAGVPTFDAEIKSKYDVAASRRYAALVRGEGFDVVHTHTRRADFVAALGGRRAGAAVVSTQHGQINLERYTLREKRDLAARVYGFCLRRFFDKHVAVSAEIADELRVRCGVDPARIVNIPNGVDAAPFIGAGRDRLSFRYEIGAPRWAVVATAVASLDVKGHADLLPAVAAVAKDGVDIRLAVVGEGHRGGPLIIEQAEELGIADRVRVLGFRDDVPRVLAGSDVFVLPTPSEGLSLAIMEAMAAGLPVVATAVGGNPELVEPGITGLLVPAGDPAALAEALRRLAREPGLRRAMGRAARSRVVLDFTVEKMADRYAALYGELLRAKGARV
jgi:glycosyltransferase involved in cell wall biosynthesis